MTLQTLLTGTYPKGTAPFNFDNILEKRQFNKTATLSVTNSENNGTLSVFSDDGLYFYRCITYWNGQSSTTEINRWTLSSPFNYSDLDGAAPDQTISFAGLSSNVYGKDIKFESGNKLHIIYGAYSDEIHHVRINLTTAWSLSSYTYDVVDTNNKLKAIAADLDQNAINVSITFEDNGNKLVFCATGSTTPFYKVFTLSPAYDTSSLSFGSKGAFVPAISSLNSVLSAGTYPGQTWESSPRGVMFSNSGYVCHILMNYYQAKAIRLSLTTPYDLSTATYQGYQEYLTLPTNHQNSHALGITNNGYQLWGLFTIRPSEQEFIPGLYYANLSTQYDISSASGWTKAIDIPNGSNLNFNQFYTLTMGDTSAVQFTAKDNSGELAFRYDMTTGNITAGGLYNQFETLLDPTTNLLPGDYSRKFTFNSNGTKAYISTYYDGVYEKTLAVAYDLTSASSPNSSAWTNFKSYNLDNRSGNIWFNANGTKFFYASSNFGSLWAGDGEEEGIILNTSLPVYEQPLSASYALDSYGFTNIAFDTSTDIFASSGITSVYTSEIRVIYANSGYTAYVYANTNYSWAVVKAELSIPYQLNSATSSAIVQTIGDAFVNTNTHIKLNQKGDFVFVRAATLTAILPPDAGDLQSYVDADKTYWHREVDFGLDASNGNGLRFKPDGTRFYSAQNTKIAAYDMSDPWNIETAVANTSADFALGGIDGFDVSPDGLRLFVCSNGGILQFNATQSWNFGTIPSTTALHSLSLYNATTQTYQLSLSSDGKALHVMMGQFDIQHMTINMTTAYDLSTAQFEELYSQTSISVESNPRGVDINPTGTKAYFVGFSSSTVREYSLPSPYNVLNSSQTSASTTSMLFYEMYFNRATANLTTGVKDPGELLFISGNSGYIRVYPMNTPYRVSELTYNNYTSISGLGGGGPIVGMAWKPDGTKMVIFDNTTKKLYEYSLSNPYDLTTKSLQNTYTSPFTNIAGMDFNHDGTELVAVEFDFADQFRIFNLGTPWSLGGTVTTETFTDYSGPLGPHYYHSGIRFCDDYNKMIGIAGNRQMFIFGLGTRGDVRTARKTDPGILRDSDTNIRIVGGNDWAFAKDASGIVPNRYFAAGSLNTDPTGQAKYLIEFTLADDKDFATIAQNTQNVYALPTGNYFYRGIYMKPDGRSIFMQVYYQDPVLGYRSKLVEVIIR